MTDGLDPHALALAGTVVADFMDWLNHGNLTGELSQHAQAGLVDTIARAVGRQRLPERRTAESVEAVHVWGAATAQEIHEPLLVTFGRYPDGRIGEVFIDSLAEAKGKLASRTVDLQKDVAVLISIALQHGASLDELSAAVGRSDVNLMGVARSMPATIAGTVLDTLARQGK